MVKKALFAGTFDPPTLGHLDLIQRAAKLSELLVVGIAASEKKPSPLFSPEERMAMWEAVLKKISNIQIVLIPGLVADYAKKHGIECLIRGVRSFSDFEYEQRMAAANRLISGLDTLILFSNHDTLHISASLIREIGKLDPAQLTGFVPPEIQEILRKKFTFSSR